MQSGGKARVSSLTVLPACRICFDCCLSELFLTCRLWVLHLQSSLVEISCLQANDEWERNIWVRFSLRRFGVFWRRVVLFRCFSCFTGVFLCWSVFACVGRCFPVLVGVFPHFFVTCFPVLVRCVPVLPRCFPPALVPHRPTKAKRNAQYACSLFHVRSFLKPF